jgi:hypothetical protein
MTQHRPELVAAGLTIMRAFIATGQDPQDHCKTWGRFERWSDMVRAPLIWLGCEDPCASLADLEKEDPERIELVRVMPIASPMASASRGPVSAITPFSGRSRRSVPHPIQEAANEVTH